MGGEHKCPLCSATFTRPQHVGRHLRAHTGDRPYECKECPLRFARSDLLSRHVNKAHPKPEGADKGKNDKRGGRRRSSVGTSNPTAGSGPATTAPGPGLHHGLPAHRHSITVTTTPAAPSSSSSHPAAIDHAQANAAVAAANAVAVNGAPVAARHSHPEPTAFQAQRMYPNHPLLQQQQQQNGASVGGLWSQNYSLAGNPQFSLLSAQLATDAMGQVNAQGIQVPFGASNVDPLNGVPAGTQASYDLNLTGPHLGADYAVKKRACDQCNHSKVRCDCAEPCARCAHRSISCTYTKQQRSRTMFPPGMPQLVNGNFRAPFATIQQPRRGSSMSSSSTTDGNGFLNVQGARLSDPQWDGQTEPANGMVQQSPASLNVALTPALTHSASPTTTEASGSERRASANSSQNSWPLPGSAFDAPFNFGGVQSDAIGLASSFPGTSGFLWSGLPPFDGTGASPNSVAISSEEDDMESIKGDSGLRRNSNASSVWANAIDGLKLDDPQGIMFDANGNLQFIPNAEQMQHQQQTIGHDDEQVEHPEHPQKMSPQRLRQTTYPMSSNDLTAQALSRGPSGPDATNLWKLFMDPNALVTPGKEHDANPMGPETPRGLSKSNSMPDLKTPTMQQGPYGPQVPPNAIDSVIADDSTDMDRWLQHIQQRHASFSMDLNASAAARKVTTGTLSNATFASSTSPTSTARLSCSPVNGTLALQQTLAPERMPSFGSNAYDDTTPNANPKTPTDKHGGMSMTPLSGAGAAERPSNKRVASQTLVPAANQKRPSISTANEDEGGSSQPSSVSSSRRSSAQFPGMSLASRVPLPSQLLQWTPTATDSR